jgi:hypothetical protein
MQCPVELQEDDTLRRNMLLPGDESQISVSKLLHGPFLVMQSITSFQHRIVLKKAANISGKCT